MSVASDQWDATLRSPGAFAASLPAMVGFHPTESLVAVYSSDGRVIVSMRVDLPDSLDEIAEYVAMTGRKVNANEVILAVFTSHDREGLPHAGEIVVVTAECEAADVVVRDVMLIDAGRWWSYLCSNQNCCPSEGTVIRPGDCALDAERAGLGLPVVAVSRDIVVERYRPRPDLSPAPEIRTEAESILLVPLGERAKQVWDDTRMLSGSRTAGDPVSDVMRSRIQVAMEDVRVRDHLMASIAQADGSHEPLVDTIVHVALTAPEDLRPRVAGAAAFLLAAFGESSIATVCLLELAEGESLAELVRISVNAAIQPSALRDVLRDSMPMVEEQLQAGTTKKRTRSRRTSA